MLKKTKTHGKHKMLTKKSKTKDNANTHVGKTSPTQNAKNVKMQKKIEIKGARNKNSKKTKY